jgi:hypothetical protein
MDTRSDTVRFYVVRHTFTVVHQGRSWDEDPELDNLGDFHFAENSCSGYVINGLAAVVASTLSTCSVCCGHSAKYIGRYDTLEAAEAANPGAIAIPWIG